MPGKGGFEDVAEINVTLPPNAQNVSAYYLIGQHKPGRADVWVRHAGQTAYELAQAGNSGIQTGLVSLGAGAGFATGAKIAIQGTIVVYGKDQPYSFETILYVDGVEVPNSRTTLSGAVSDRAFYVSTTYTMA